MPRLVVVHSRDGQPASRRGVALIPEPRRCLDPLDPSEHTWRFGNFAWVLINLSMQPQAVLLVTLGLEHGLTWEWLLATSFLTSLLGALFIILMTEPSHKYGISLSVVARASFGRWGSSLFSLAYLAAALPWVASFLGIASYGLRTGILSVAPMVASIDPIGLDRNTRTKAILGQGGQSFLTILLIVVLALILWLNFLRRSSVFCLGRFTPIFASMALSFYLSIGWWARQAVGIDKSLTAFNAEAGRTMAPTIENLVWGVPVLVASGMGFWSTVALGLPDVTRYAFTKNAYRRPLLFVLPLATTAITFLLLLGTGSLCSLHRDLPSSTTDLLPLVPRDFILPISIITSLSTLYSSLGAHTIAAANAITNITNNAITSTTAAGLFLLISVITAALNPATGIIVEYPRWTFISGLIAGGLIGVIASDYFIMRRWRLPTDHLYKTQSMLHMCGVNGAAVVALILSYGLVVSPWVVHALTGYSVMSGHWTATTLLPLGFTACFVLALSSYLLSFRCFNSAVATAQAPPASSDATVSTTTSGGTSHPHHQHRPTHLQLTMPTPTAPAGPGTNKMFQTGHAYYDHLYAVTAPMAPPTGAEETKSATIPHHHRQLSSLAPLPRPAYAHAIAVHD